ncbi:hypothetical protein K491DRAFT_720188 [Lophiostoma macrostomum CBS 122681]|uniref:J domain-containing protein n=1 Tax=Lophiostoma macrostomum CBS 122681 TaxID=1314788 RepID=A0A6A6STZ8_9PLEO|nr:hypothetical protein K491DRAFT_720188 [Lophiostoma macrostomum CBS 122681]
MSSKAQSGWRSNERTQGTQSSERPRQPERNAQRGEVPQANDDLFAGLPSKDEMDKLNRQGAERRACAGQGPMPTPAPSYHPRYATTTHEPGCSGPEAKQKLADETATELRGEQETMKMHCDALGVKVSDGPNEFRKAYWKKSQKVHPDKNVDINDLGKTADTAAFVRINDAFEWLTENAERQATEAQRQEAEDRAWFFKEIERSPEDSIKAIEKGWKVASLKFHPDRHYKATDTVKAENEVKIKRLNEQKVKMIAEKEKGGRSGYEGVGTKGDHDWV